MDPLRPAGFWIRALALAVDLVVFALVQFSWGFVAGWFWGADVEDSWTFQFLIVAFTLAFTGAYFTVLHALSGQTVGKMLVGARVVADDGQPPPLGAALLRSLATFVSLATLLMGFAMAGLRRDKRALHDLIAGTRVERVRSRRALQEPAPSAEELASRSASSGGA